MGYLPAKTIMVKCVLGIWKGADIKCVPVDCGKPKLKRAIVGKITYLNFKTALFNSNLNLCISISYIDL